MFESLKELVRSLRSEPETIQECTTFRQERGWFSRNGLSRAMSRVTDRSQMQQMLMDVWQSDWYRLKRPELIEAIDHYFKIHDVDLDELAETHGIVFVGQPRYCRLHHTRHVDGRCGYRNIKRRPKTHRILQR